MNKKIVTAAVFIIITLSVLAFFHFYLKSFFGAAVSPYSSITLKLGITPPSYIGNTFTNYSALITNVDPAVGCPPAIAYGQPLPSLTGNQMAYVTPSSITCSLGSAAAGTCTGTTSGEDTVILTFNNTLAPKFFPNNIYVIYLWINDPRVTKQNYTSLCIRLNSVPPGAPQPGALVQSATWPTQGPVTQPPENQGTSIMVAGANFAGGYHSGANSILANGYFSWTPYDIYGGKIPLPIIMTTPKKYIVIYSAYLVSGTNMSVSIGYTTKVITSTTASTYIAYINGPATGTLNIDVAASSTDSPMAVVALKLLDVRQLF